MANRVLELAMGLMLICAIAIKNKLAGSEQRPAAAYTFQINVLRK